MNVHKWNLKGTEEEGKQLQFLVKTAMEEINQADDAVFNNKDGFYRSKEMDNEIGDAYLLDRDLNVFKPHCKSIKNISRKIEWRFD